MNLSEEALIDFGRKMYDSQVAAGWDTYELFSWMDVVLCRNGMESYRESLHNCSDDRTAQRAVAKWYGMACQLDQNDGPPEKWKPRDGYDIEQYDEMLDWMTQDPDTALSFLCNAVVVPEGEVPGEGEISQTEADIFCNILYGTLGTEQMNVLIEKHTKAS